MNNSANLIEQPFNDYGNAQRFIAMSGDVARYCPAFNAWLIYDNKCWAYDRLEIGRRLAQETC